MNAPSTSSSDPLGDQTKIRLNKKKKFQQNQTIVNQAIQQIQSNETSSQFTLQSSFLNKHNFFLLEAR